LPTADPTGWSVMVEREEQEPVIEDPMTECTLKRALEYIDRSKVR